MEHARLVLSQFSRYESIRNVKISHLHSQVETTLEPLELLDAVQDIENTLGRKKVIDKGPRNIDLDILLYDNITLDHPRLKIPHIGIPEREFVLKPLTE